MGRKVEKVFFGSVAMHRLYCPDCKDTALILNGKHLCCGAEVSEMPDQETLKRETEGSVKRLTVKAKDKRRILAEQDNRCIYCGAVLDGLAWNRRKVKYFDIRINFDHFICWKYSRDSHKANIVAACHICNGLKGSKYFDTVEAAREFILERRIKKGWVNEEDKLKEEQEEAVPLGEFRPRGKEEADEHTG